MRFLFPQRNISRIRLVLEAAGAEDLTDNDDWTGQAEEGVTISVDVEKRDLAAEIASSQHERAIWSEGRKAYRQYQIAAINPYSASTPAYGLWEEGFEHQEAQASCRSPSW